MEGAESTSSMCGQGYILATDGWKRYGGGKVSGQNPVAIELMVLHWIVKGGNASVGSQTC